MSLPKQEALTRCCHQRVLQHATNPPQPYFQGAASASTPPASNSRPAGYMPHWHSHFFVSCQIISLVVDQHLIFNRYSTTRNLQKQAQSARVDAPALEHTSNSTGSFLAGADTAAHWLRATLLPNEADLVILRVCLDSDCNTSFR